MDIAEIRKKAKAGQQNVADDGSHRGPLEQNSPEELVYDEPVIDPSADLQDIETASDLPPEASSVSTDALDQLFGENSHFELATEEAYEDALATQAIEELEDIQQYLSFQLGREEYALDITRISEIIKVREFTEIPRVPDFILGIISLRGVVVPVFDLKKRCHLGEADMTPASRIIVCQLGEMTAGLLVDRINQVIHLNEATLEPAPGVLSGLDRELIEGVGRYSGRMIIVLNLRSVLDVDLI